MGKRLKRVGNGTAIIDDTAWEKLAERIKGLAGGPYTKVGVLASSDGPVDGDASFNMASLATVHEYGSGRVPARSFIRRTMLENEQALAKFTADLAARVVAGQLSEDRALELLGKWGEGAVKRTILRGPHIPPPLAQSTIEAKGSTRPLVDEGHLAGSINHEVTR